MARRFITGIAVVTAAAVFWTGHPDAQTSGPVVSSLSGTVADGGTVQLSGSGFGAKTTATPLKWDNFEAGANGSGLTNWDYFGTRPTYSSTVKRAKSNMSARANFVSGAWNSAFGVDGMHLPRVYIDAWSLARFRPPVLAQPQAAAPDVGRRRRTAPRLCDVLRRRQLPHLDGECLRWPLASARAGELLEAVEPYPVVPAGVVARLQGRHHADVGGRRAARRQGRSHAYRAARPDGRARTSASTWATTPTPTAPPTETPTPTGTTSISTPRRRGSRSATPPPIQPHDTGKSSCRRRGRPRRSRLR